MAISAVSKRHTEWRAGLQMWSLLSCSYSEHSHEESQGARTRGNSCSRGAKSRARESMGRRKGPTAAFSLYSLFPPLLPFFSLLKTERKPRRKAFWARCIGQRAGRCWARGLGFYLQLDSTFPLWKRDSDININISTWFSVFGVIRIEQVGSSESWCRC